jgi:neutral ceramidase
MTSTWQVGSASVDLAPPVGLPLMGNYRNDYRARGQHDPLLAHAIVFADEHDRRAAWLALDLCMVDRDNVAMIRQGIRQRCRVDPEAVLIHATHTHSAPAVNGRLGMSDLVASHQPEIEKLLARAADAVRIAEDRLQPATVTVGGTTAQRVSFHRRLRDQDGSTVMNWESLDDDFDPSGIDRPWGPIDAELVALGIHRGAQLVATVVNFGLHPAILAGDNWLYSADFPGAMARQLARRYPTCGTAMFLNGCCGNVNHVDYRDRSQGRGFALVERVGCQLADSSDAALRSAMPLGEGPLRVSRRFVSLERAPVSDQQLRWCEDVLNDAAARPPSGQVDGLPDAYFAELRLAMREVQDQPDEVEVMVMRLGNTAIVGLPGEVFCESGIDIKSRSPAEYTLVAGLTNDAIGYLPNRPAFAAGGYETMLGSTFYPAGAAERIVDSAVDQLLDLFDRPA